MLGRLLSTAISSSATPKPQANDDAEEAHTRALLYQGNNTFSTCNCADNDGGAGCIRDVRVIIAQDSVSGDPKLTVYDSVPIATPSGFSRKADAPGLSSSGHRGRRRSNARISVSGIQFTPNTSVEDERKVLQECMFGSSIMAYKGPSTKVHVLPSAPQTSAPVQTTLSSSAPQRIRRNSLKSPSSHTSGHTEYASFPTANTQDDIKSVLITRTFNVVLPSTQPPQTLQAPPAPTHQHHVSFKVPAKDDSPVTPGSSVGSTHGFPFPNMNTKQGTPPSALKAVKPPKTINYAIGLIIAIPNNVSHQTNSFRQARQSIDIEFIDPLATIRRPNQATLPDEIAENLVDNRMDLVTKNWDIITRTLNELQVVATQRITAALGSRGIILSPSAYGPHRKSSLDTAALMNDAIIKEEVDRQRWRIRTGLQIPRVITGQGRWLEWRDEAKWASNAYGGRDRNFFFLTLLTAFLGHHPDWLDVLAPPAYRRRHVQKQRSLGKEDAYVPSRTVVVSDNKFVSRRLIYLLAAFLPERSSPTTHWTGDYASSNRSTVSDEGLGRSPPGKVPEFTKREIRRVPSKLSMVEGVDENDGSALASTWDIPRISRSVENDKERSVSKIVGTSLPSQFNTGQLPIPFTAARKAPSTTTTDSMIPHPADLSSSFKGETPEPRPGSSGSSVSVNLMQTLRRSGSNNTSGNTNDSSGGTNTSGWGSFLSSIWSSPRSRGSTSVASSLASTVADDTNAESGRLRRAGTGFSDVMYDDDQHGYPGLYEGHAEDSRHVAFSPPKHWHQDGIRTPGFEESTLRYSVDDDGIIDVDIPLGLPNIQPNFDMGGLGGLGSSPLPSSPTSTNPAEASMESSLISLSALTLLPPFPQATGESETTGNVAAELERFHPDFILQGVKPYADLERDIRRGMQAEPTPAIVITPAHESGTEESKWIDICSTLIADTNNMKIRRLTLRRQRRPTPPFSQHLTPAQLVAHSFAKDGNEIEKFIDEDVMDMEELLVSAVERVTESSSKSAIPSRSPSVIKSPKSRPPIPRRRTDASADGKFSEQDTRKAVLGSLEEVVRKVAEDRKGVVENVLTEGVAKWLNELEDAGVV